MTRWRGAGRAGPAIARARLSRPAVSRTRLSRTRLSRTGLSGRGWSGPGRSGPGWSGPGRSGPGRSGPGGRGGAVGGIGRSGPAVSRTGRTRPRSGSGRALTCRSRPRRRRRASVGAARGADLASLWDLRRAVDAPHGRGLLAAGNRMALRRAPHTQLCPLGGQMGLRGRSGNAVHYGGASCVRDLPLTGSRASRLVFALYG